MLFRYSVGLLLINRSISRRRTIMKNESIYCCECCVGGLGYYLLVTYRKLEVGWMEFCGQKFKMLFLNNLAVRESKVD